MFLMRRVGRTRRERGAVAAMVVIIFASMALFGIGALTIDVGGFYSEKGQLQNGADSAAIAVARSCAKGACNVGTDLSPIAQHFANENALDGKAFIEEVCGSMTGGVCAKPNTCPPAPTGGTHWVDVHVSTLTEDDAHALPTIFGKAVVGDDYDSQINACAQAIWGPPKLGNILALTIAECAWNTVTHANPGPPNYAPAPPAVPAASYETALVVHNPDDPTDPNCVSGPNVGPLPGGFGWTQQDSSSATPCTTSFIPTSGGWYTSDSGQGSDTTTKCLKSTANGPGVIPCAQNPAVTGPPFPPSTLNSCLNPPTPSPLIVPIYDKVCVQTGSTSASTNEVQQITITNATGGTFQLSFTDAGGISATTGNLARDITAGALQTALQNLSTIGANNVTVASTVAGSYTVTFGGALQFKDVNELVPTSSLLPSTGRNKASITVNTTTNGFFAATACPAGFSNGKYFHLLTLAAFVVTGYQGSAFPHDESSWLTGRDWCVNEHGSDPPCLLGYFTQTVAPGDIDPNGTDTGVTAVKLSG